MECLLTIQSFQAHSSDGFGGGRFLEVSIHLSSMAAAAVDFIEEFVGVVFRVLNAFITTWMISC